jgi:hypothetical protein
MTGQTNVNMAIRKRKFGWIGHTLRKRQLCNGIHKVREEGVGQEFHGDELHWRNAGSAAGVILGLLPGTEKDGYDF